MYIQKVLRTEYIQEGECRIVLCFKNVGCSFVTHGVPYIYISPYKSSKKYASDTDTGTGRVY